MMISPEPMVMAQSSGVVAIHYVLYFWFLPHDAILVRYILSSCIFLSVRLSVTSWHCTKTAKHRIMEMMPYDILGTLVFSGRNSNGFTPNGGAKSIRWMTYSHLRTDCLYTGISSGPNARVWEAFTFFSTLCDERIVDNSRVSHALSFLDV